jgi:hypothetical protein
MPGCTRVQVSQSPELSRRLGQVDQPVTHNAGGRVYFLPFSLSAPVPPLTDRSASRQSLPRRNLSIDDYDWKMPRWLKIGVIGGMLTQPIAVALALWDIVHGRLPRHPFQRQDAALLGLRERAQRYVAEDDAREMGR